MYKNPEDYWKLIFNYFKLNKHLYEDDETFLFAYDSIIDKKYILSRVNINACKRHLLFLYKSVHDENFPFFYDKTVLPKLVRFSKNIIVPEINKAFIFPRFRKFMAGVIFGWKLVKDPEKLMVQEIFDVEARKQWKSSFWAMVILAWVNGFTGDRYSEIYISGPQRDTSRVPFNIATNYIRKSPSLQHFFSAWNSSHIIKKDGGVIKHLSFEKSALEGKNPSITMLTEYHLHPNDSLQESASSSRNKARKNQLIIYDTTKGHKIDSVCYSREMDYKGYLQNQIDNPFEIDPNYDVFIWAAELDPEDYDNWKDSSLWVKANPNLDVSVDLEQLKLEFNKITDRRKEVEFKTKRLGMWVGEASAYFELSTILNSNAKAKVNVNEWLKENKLKNLQATLGIDLSTIHDTTHIVLNFEIPQPDGDPIWYFIGHGYIPDQNVDKKEQSDRAQYYDWQRQGSCTLTKGSIVDYDYLISKVNIWNKEYQIDAVGYDAWQFNTIKQNFLKNNIFYEPDLIPVRQGVALSPIFKEFERKLHLGKVYFDDNKMLINHITNVSIKELNGTSGNILIQKLSKNNRIDGFIAMLMGSRLRIDIDDSPSKTGHVIKLN